MSALLRSEVFKRPVLCDFIAFLIIESFSFVGSRDYWKNPLTHLRLRWNNRLEGCLEDTLDLIRKVHRSVSLGLLEYT